MASHTSIGVNIQPLSSVLYSDIRGEDFTNNLHFRGLSTIKRETAFEASNTICTLVT